MFYINFNWRVALKNLAVNGDAIIQVLNQLKSRQAIVVVWEKGYHADLYLYESVNHQWIVADKIQANVGLKGMGKTEEGDQKSPAGIFSLATAFGIAPPPAGINYPYRMITGDDYWVDDSLSQLYNKWVQFKDDYWKDWNSAEPLGRETIAYQYAVIINYNPARLPGKGSAIFLHVRTGEDSPTQGCTAVSEEDMVHILQWLDFDKKPVLLQGTWADITAISKEQTIPLQGIPEGFVYVEDIIPDILVDIQYSTEGSLPNAAILTIQAAWALAKAQRKLMEQDYCIKILDAYRPQKSTAFQSPHYRGSALDITLMDLKTGQEPDMGTENRSMLRNVMESSGFKMEDTEWWHFTLADEPYPHQYFNFPVSR
jgi:L,D-peptidoglycan transpeptidase YkuD (ErfK/YbiS/YcfS/YnhG family)/D-alanyl-D-alanine dipeptidase